MKHRWMMKVMHDEPHFEPEPYYEMHLDFVFMTEREFKNAIVVIHKMLPKLDVVNRR